MPATPTVRRLIYFGALTYSIFPIVVVWYIWWEPVRAPGFSLGPLAMLYLLLVGRWDLVSYGIRFIFLLALLVVTWYRAGWWLPALILIAFLAASIVLRQAAPKAVHLEFPLRDGIFYVAHGGSISALNQHHGSESQRFALDITALTWLGARATGISPRMLERYRVFARPVHSPCSGTVTAVVSDLPDQIPGQMAREHFAGNHVVIRQTESDTYVGLAHLMQGTIVVQAGEQVRAGQYLARVGNSGNTSEPHLHIHAKKGGDPHSMLDGRGVPMLFNGRWLIRNSIVRGWRSRRTASLLQH